MIERNGTWFSTGRRVVCAVPLVFAALLAGCDDEDDATEIIVNTGPTSASTPTVLHATPIDGVLPALFGRLDERSLWVQFGDADGFDDLGTATLTIGSIRLVDVEARDYISVADVGGFCNDTGPDFSTELEFDLDALMPSEPLALGPILVDHSDFELTMRDAAGNAVTWDPGVFRVDFFYSEDTF